MLVVSYYNIIEVKRYINIRSSRLLLKEQILNTGGILWL